MVGYSLPRKIALNLYSKATKNLVRQAWTGFHLPPLSLQMLAALTPEDIEVQIVDEQVEPVSFEIEANLVGITCTTRVANRAFEIADEFRKRGTKVVMGGYHPTFMPEECLQHVDAICKGEAEGCWRQLLVDARRGELKKVYSSSSFVDPNCIPLPRRDLLKKDAYLTVATVQTSRGCPFGCSFCAVTAFYGHQYRCRPVEHVIEEVESLDSKFVFFVDDNIVGHRRHAKALFRALRNLNIRWASSVSITIADNPELLSLAAESGCIALAVGIESLHPVSKEFMDKHAGLKCGPEETVEAIEKRLHKIREHGIVVMGNFIFGLDEDNDGVFAETRDFVQRNRLEIALYNILTPFPGTAICDKLSQEGRILSKNWDDYDGFHVTIKPRLMSPSDLWNGVHWLYDQTYSYSSILRRLLSNRNSPLTTLFINLAFRQAFCSGKKGAFANTLEYASQGPEAETEIEHSSAE